MTMDLSVVWVIVTVLFFFPISLSPDFYFSGSNTTVVTSVAGVDYTTKHTWIQPRFLVHVVRVSHFFSWYCFCSISFSYSLSIFCFTASHFFYWYFKHSSKLKIYRLWQITTLQKYRNICNDPEYFSTSI
jgi:hypothetical protein